MKYSCDMIRDLLSLYCDNVCSEDSRRAVEEHLAECGECQIELKKIKDNTYTDSLKGERNLVIEAYKKGRRKAALTVLSVIFAIPAVTCFIVNIAVSHRLDWFFIVLTSLMVLGTLVLVPLAARQKKFMWTFFSFTASLLLLLLTCCIYSGGSWFITAAVSVLFGLSVVFLPFAVRQLPLRGALGHHKGLAVMTVDTLLLALLLLICVGGEEYRTAFSIMGYCMILPWGLFLVIRYLKVNGFIKAGICSVVTGLFLSFADVVTDILINGRIVYTKGFWNANLAVWENDMSSNIMLIILLSGVLLGAMFIVCGVVYGRRKSRKS